VKSWGSSLTGPLRTLLVRKSADIWLRHGSAVAGTCKQNTH
jgi:hypothetical protein